MEIEKKYMERALELARYGAGFVSPNPMVGAVIVDYTGRIIGEGWHRKYGGPHAEVNAMNSVSTEDEVLLPSSTIYVTLEPCSHYGKTPPCSKLLIEKRIARVVIGSPDPFPLVAGRGVRMLREAGIEVIEGFMHEECDWLNRRFITAHTLHRPYILLKWAQSADGFIAGLLADPTPEPVKFSTPLSLGIMHGERALYDAILVGTNTLIIDDPSLDTRLRPGKSPLPVFFGSSRLPGNLKIFQREPIRLDSNKTIEENMKLLYKEYSITSLMVEGGAETLESFISAGLFDEIRIEVADITLKNGLKAPTTPPDIRLSDTQILGKNKVFTFFRSPNF